MPQVKRRAKSKPKPPEVEDRDDEENEDFDEDENGEGNGNGDENGEDENGNAPQVAQQSRERGDLKLEIDEDKVTVELSRTGNEANVLGHVADLLDDLT